MCEAAIAVQHGEPLPFGDAPRPRFLAPVCRRYGRGRHRPRRRARAPGRLVLAEGDYGERVTLLPYRSDELVLVLPAGHALARRRRVRLAEVLDHEFVGTHPGSAINASLARGAAEAGRPLKLRMQVTGFDALCLMVAAGLGLGVMPRGSALIYRSALGLRTLTLAEPWAQRRLMLCVRAQGELPGVARHLVAHLQD